jgi:hypothetical protein
LKCTLQISDENVRWVKERTSDWHCVQPKHVKKKTYSEQYKRYNLSQGHHCGQAGSETVVRAALIYYWLHSGLFTRIVHSVQWCWNTRYVAMLVWPQTRGVGSLHMPNAN